MRFRSGIASTKHPENAEFRGTENSSARFRRIGCKRCRLDGMPSEAQALGRRRAAAVAAAHWGSRLTAGAAVAPLQIGRQRGKPAGGSG